MAKSKLIRNLKPGEKFYVSRETTMGRYENALVTVSRVQETRRGHFTGKRMWEVIGNYPWWWTTPMTAYSTDRINVVS